MIIGVDRFRVAALLAAPLLCSVSTTALAQALKDGPTSPPTLRISTQLQEDGRIAVEIQDNGKGIAPEHLGRVFEPFFTTQRMGTTSGLGLSVCYGIILGLGGDITVDSTLGQGAIAENIAMCE